ncbi:MAG: VWA domain-containing protein, partial [Alphaproteobacteria bacterium]|nr:VWA domain-containing protein [Alphaproteobacteria bacterium]
GAGAVDPVDGAAPARFPSPVAPYLGRSGVESVPRLRRPDSPLVAAAVPPAITGAGLRSSPDQREGRVGAKKDAEVPPQCVGSPPMGRIVFVLDGTLSMGLPLDVDGAFEDRLDDAIARHDAEARRQYRALLAEPGPKRITRAREAFTAAAQDLPDWVDLGLVVFQECKDVRKVGSFEAPRRGRAIDYIRSLIPHGRTPIAAGLRHAAEMLGEGPSSIVLLTDGRESCSGDPCAAAAEIHQAHPDTPVYVIDITGQAKAECVAEITGGKTYTPAATDDLAKVLHNAFRGTDARCSRMEE